MPKANNQTIKNKPVWQALALAWELGYTIAIPLVILALAGRLADKLFSTSPWLLLSGVLFSIIISTWLVYKKTKIIVSSSLAANQLEEKSKRQFNDE